MIRSTPNVYGFDFCSTFRVHKTHAFTGACALCWPIKHITTLHANRTLLVKSFRLKRWIKVHNTTLYILKLLAFPTNIISEMTKHNPPPNTLAYAHIIVVFDVWRCGPINIHGSWSRSNSSHMYVPFPQIVWHIKHPDTQHTHGLREDVPRRMHWIFKSRFDCGTKRLCANDAQQQHLRSEHISVPISMALKVYFTLRIYMIPVRMSWRNMSNYSGDATECVEFFSTLSRGHRTQNKA